MKFIISESKIISMIEKKLGVDLTKSFEMIRSIHDIPEPFSKMEAPSTYNHYLNRYGPMYLIKTDKDTYLYQIQDNFGSNVETIMSTKGWLVEPSKIWEELGIPNLFGTLQELINVYEDYVEF